jgi:hypothetical protein
VISIGDSATIRVDLYSGNNLVDTGNYFETSSTSNYKKIVIPISQLSNVADSALIRIVGGKKQNTDLYVDNFTLIKEN